MSEFIGHQKHKITSLLSQENCVADEQGSSLKGLLIDNSTSSERKWVDVKTQKPNNFLMP